MSKTIKMKERTLLIYSEVIKQYPDILELLGQNKNITNEFIEGLPERQKNFFENMYFPTLKIAIDEWEGDLKRIQDKGPDPSNWMRCSLDNVKNRHIFYIENKINKNSLNVGSECIKHFWDSWKHDYKGKNITQLKKEATRNRLLSDLNDVIPGIHRIIGEWNNKIDNCEIIIPMSLENPYFELGNEASRLLDYYLEERVGIDCSEQFGGILKRQKQLIHEIDDYISAHHNDKYIPTKEIRSWLKINGQKAILDMLKKNGRITWGTAHRIEEPSFIKLMVTELNPKMMEIGFRIDIDHYKNGYILEPVNRDKVQLFSKHSKLIQFCGYLLFDEKPIDEFTLDNLLKCCSIKDNDNMISVLLILNRILSRHHYDFEIENSYIEGNEIIIHSILTAERFIGNIKEIVDKFTGLAVGSTLINEDEFIAYIENIPGKRYSKEEFKDYQGVRKDFNARF
ncbi:MULTISPECIES: hypothetical protein [unclassified Dehalobacter]|jgi:hypothetical protein|uniref:hypothetical protein n=1 Tax=unclassified Dehalobacter TaxID=2635733 RepID=UPI00028B73C3|nr:MULTISPECIES: hypothetical protein [unclassified Dehalobacter]AFV02830.1 hypothetical protein DHBDCA_p1804 [Dehalobacter sp. DCA]AFV05817.1 hypothetical protein DCF50_p1815 [Dehalobacter sp. CF]